MGGQINKMLPNRKNLHLGDLLCVAEQKFFSNFANWTITKRLIKVNTLLLIKLLTL